MTTLLHLSDTHLGYRAYGAPERTEDFVRAFDEALAVALDRDVDAVVHTGDVTDAVDSRELFPDRIVSRLESLAAADIPFYYILGNHDITDDGQPQDWAVELEANGLATHLDDTPAIVGGDTALYGLDYRDAGWWEVPDLEFVAPESDGAFTLLCLHQDVRPFAPPGGGECDLSAVLDASPVSFDAVALGHLHRPMERVVDGVPAFYGGATERLDRADVDREPAVHLLEIDDGELTRERYPLPSRPFSTWSVVPGDRGSDALVAAVRDCDVDGHVVDVTVCADADAVGTDLQRAFVAAGALDVRTEFDGSVDTTAIEPGVYSGRPHALTAGTKSGEPPSPVVAIPGDDGGSDRTGAAGSASGTAPDDGTAGRRRAAFESKVPGGGTCAYGFDPAEWEDAFDGESALDAPWACPHDAVDGSEYCPFHLPAEDRRRLDWSGDRTAERLLSTVGRPGADAKAFVGARLDGLDLRHWTIDPPDNHPIDLRHAVIEGPVRIASSQLHTALRLDRARVEALLVEGTTLAGVSCAHTTFTGEESSRRKPVECDDARFGGAVDFTDATVRGTADFEDVTFEAEVDFEGATVERAARFRDARFARDVSFRHVGIDGKATFFGAYFGGFVNFYSATFGERADFRYADLAESGYFQRTTFESRADFTRATIGPAESKFRGATFEDAAVFADATVEGIVRFSGDDSGVGSWEPPTFRGEADFEGATFESLASFDGAVFEDGVAFDGATFLDVARFDGAELDAEATFAGAAFEAAARFDGAAFDGEVDFRDAVFDGEVRFETPRFGGTASFADAAFAALHLERPVCEAPPGRLVFERAEIEGGLIVQGTDPPVLDLTAARLGDVRFESPDGQPLLPTLAIRRTDFDRFDFATFREHLDDSWTLHTVADRFADAVEEPEAATLETTYLKAKRGASQSGDMAASAAFFLKEMYYRRRRHAAAADGAESRPEWFRAKTREWRNLALHVTTGYGERPSYVIGWSFAVLAAFGLVFAGIDFVSPATLSRPYTTPLGYASLSVESFVTLVLGGSQNVNSGLVRALSYLEAFAGAFLIALFVFTLTRSVHR